jgi:C4-dicarboxylate transporter DctQ subunit
MKLEKVFTRFVDALGAIIFSIITIVSFGQIVARYCFGVSFAFASELAVELMIWIAFLGAAKCVAENAHTRLTVAVDFLPPKARSGMMLLSNLLCMGFLTVAAWYGFRLVHTTWRGTTIGTHVPEGLIYLAMPLSSVLMIVFFISKTVNEIHRISEPAGERE